MTFFYDSPTILQIILLVLSQLAIILFTTGFVFLYKRKSKFQIIGSMGIMLLINIILYVFMQLDSRITGAEEGFRLPMPILLLAIVILLSMGVGVWIILGETKNRKTINNTSIKEAFDNLPTGVCFFNESGLPVLCNYEMYRFSFAVTGKDVQFITDLQNCLEKDFVSETDAKRIGKVFVMPNGKAWRLEKRSFTYEDKKIYTQFIATDVTELNKKRVELVDENNHLRQVQSDLHSLSANVVAVTREEEILNTKMRVHDEMGKCLMTAQKFLKQDSIEEIPDEVALSWQRAVSMLKYNNDVPDEDMLLQIRKTCDSLNLSFKQTGELPKEETAAYLLTCAVRECVTNAVRYADATELNANFSETETEATVTVTNNGLPPQEEIKEGGGLSTLRRRIERSGGIMKIQSLPFFKLTVTVHKDRRV